MNIAQLLRDARPETSSVDTHFTDKVMQRIAKQSQRHVSLWRVARMSPVAAALLTVLALGLFSGVVYAVVSYLWSDVNVTINEQQRSASDRQQFSLYAGTCGTEDKHRMFEVRRGVDMTQEEMMRAARADCEWRTVSAWADQTFGGDYSDIPTGVPVPGAEHTIVHVSGHPSTVERIDGRSITVKSYSTETRVHDIPEQAMIVDDRQPATLADISVGDTVLVIERSIVTYRNAADCTNKHCSGENQTQKDDIVAVVRVDFTVDDYRLIERWMKLSPCMGNEQEMCHENLAAYEIFSRKFEANAYFADDTTFAIIEGELLDFTDNELTIRMSTGRMVKIGTPHGIVTTFNQQSANHFGLSVTKGDRITTMYAITDDQQQRIDQAHLFDVSVLLEVASRTEPGNLKKY